MRERRADFYDPLYDFVTFEEASRSRPRAFLDVAFSRSGVASAGAQKHGDSISPLNEAKVILPFLAAVEFTRQSFLRQSNLAFLVYPSATHTRFAHAVGSCYLGFVASQRVTVRQQKVARSGSHVFDDPIYLAKFLEDTGLREEFYLALLLHDVGHFPFSHTLENNREFWDAFGEEIKHENAACQLILGEGPIFEASKRRRNGISKKLQDACPHLSELFEQFPDIDKYSICYLISGNGNLIAGRPPQQRAHLRVIHELVSGLFDLDRVDHYRRDNYFTGLRTGTALNFPSLLSGLSLSYNPADPEKDPYLSLSSSAVGHAISLLQNKERLTEDCFEHPYNISYEAMLHHAFNMFIFGDDCYGMNSSLSVDVATRTRVYDLLVSTDEQLLFTMEQGGSRKVREVVFRIVNRLPYLPVAKLIFPPECGLSLVEIRRVIAALSRVSVPDVILRALRGFGRDRLSFRSSEWLDLERLRNIDGKRLVDGRFGRQIEHFKQAQDGSPDQLWLYGTNVSTATRLSKILHLICKDLGCQLEED